MPRQMLAYPAEAAENNPSEHKFLSNGSKYGGGHKAYRQICGAKLLLSQVILRYGRYAYGEHSVYKQRLTDKRRSICEHYHSEESKNRL